MYKRQLLHHCIEGVGIGCVSQVDNAVIHVVAADFCRAPLWCIGVDGVKTVLSLIHISFALLDTKNDKPKYVFVDGEPEACDWVKGAAKSYTFTTRVEGVEAGKYMWAVGIVDTTKQNEIGIHLAVKNNVTSAGWLKLFEVTAR